MAENKETIIIDVQLTDNATAEKIAQIKQEIIDLNNANKDIEKTMKESGKAHALEAKTLQENKKRIAELKGELKDYDQAIKDDVKEQRKANKEREMAADSLDGMRRELKKVTKEYDALTKAERESAKGKEMKKHINELTDGLNEAEQATGRFQRNVGNYTSALDNLTGGLIASTKAALKFIATPIGAVIAAIVVAVKALTSAFKRTETNGDALAEALGGLSAVGNVLMKSLEPIAKFMGEVFAGAIEKVTNLLIKLGIVDKEAVDKAKDLATAERELARAMRDQEKIQLQYQNRAEKLRQIRDDESLSLEQRIAANKELGDVLEEQSQKELAIANEAVRVAKLRNEIEGETTENMEILAEAETRVIDIEERIQGQRSEMLMNINSLNRETQAYTKSLIDANVEALKFLEQSMSKDLPSTRKVVSVILDEEDEEEGESSDEMWERYKAKQQRKIEIEGETIDNLKEQKKLALEEEYATEIAAATMKGEDVSQINEWYAKKNADIAKWEMQQRIDAITAETAFYLQKSGIIVGSIKKIAEASGANAEFTKTLAIAEVAINSGVALAEGVKSAAGLPFPANLISIAATIAQITANIVSATQMVRGANVPKPAFAKGGLVTGEGSGTSDSIDAKLSNGEAVINAKSVRQYAPLLSAINVAGGGVPIGTSTTMRNEQELSDIFRDAVTSTPIYVAVTDINEGQQRVANIIDNANY